jgi:hypothetical protein
MGNGPSQNGEQSAGDASSSSSKRSKLRLKRPARRTKRGDSVHSNKDDRPAKDSFSVEETKLLLVLLVVVVLLVLPAVSVKTSVKKAVE